MKAPRFAAWVVVIAASCTVHLGDTGGGGDPAEEFTNSVQISGGQRVSGAAPQGTFDLPAASPSTVRVSPGNSFSIPIPTGVSDVAALNVSFGGGSYFRVPVTGGGVVAASAGSFCGNLSDICHQIQCYEQVVTSSGTVSRAQATAMVLNCTGGTDCNGTAARCGDGVCNNLEGPSTCPQDCGATGDDCCVRTNGCPGETGHSCGATCCCCGSGMACGRSGSSYACVRTP